MRLGACVCTCSVALLHDPSSCNASAGYDMEFPAPTGYDPRRHRIFSPQCELSTQLNVFFLIYIIPHGASQVSQRIYSHPYLIKTKRKEKKKEKAKAANRFDFRQVGPKCQQTPNSAFIPD